MMRWSICLCAVLFAASCTSDGGPGTEAPGGGVGGTGSGGVSGSAGNASGAGGAGGAGAGGVGGSAGIGGMSGAAGEGGAGGVAGDLAAGMGGSGGSEPNDDDAGITDDASIDDGGADEGYCTVACTGIGPDENVAEACAMITSSDECAMFETGGFPASCRWVTPDSEPCLAP